MIQKIFGKRPFDKEEETEETSSEEPITNNDA